MAYIKSIKDSELGVFEQFHSCHLYVFISTPRGRPGKMLLLNGTGDLVTEDTEKAEAANVVFL